ncbi:MAG TPA: serine/threonine-protein kinase, partial [Pirellulales bacterium]|nr:serine/threonine-protein kinase [Pirellulales bacterium]
MMELVKGVPITKYCDELRLSLRERLALFVPVCQAIQHAHQKGIIHRDIKPSNVMIAMQDGKPVSKVIDFGVAKALHRRLTDESLYTDIGQIVGTLEYMSPEQAELSPLDIDTRADVYAVGALLYELLTGTTPLDRKRTRQAAYTEMLRQIREVEPPKPSTRLSDSRETLASVAAMRKSEPARLTNELRGELDWIAMKCLEKDRTRRYESASDLARDIERYLHDETVEACPPSKRYRLGKFLRKHRAGVLTTAALLGLLLTGVAVSAWQAVRATVAEANAKEKEVEAIANERKALAAAAAERAAKQEAQVAAAAEQQAKDKAQQAIGLLVGAVAEAELLKDERFQPLRKKLLAGALRYYQEFIRDHEHDALARRDLAKALEQVGRISHESGSADDALAAYARAAELRQSLAAESPTIAEYQNRLAVTYLNLGALQSATGDSNTALASYQRAIEIEDKLARESPTATEYQRSLAIIYSNLGALKKATGDSDTALASYLKAIEIEDKLALENPSVTEYQHRLAVTYLNLGALQSETGDSKTAMASYLRAIEIEDNLARENPSVTEYQSDMANSYSALGDLQTATGDPNTALASYQMAIEIQDKVVRENPTVAKWQRQMATTYGSLGRLQSATG